MAGDRVNATAPTWGQTMKEGEKHMKTRMLAAAGLIIAALAMSSAQAAPIIIYQDDFSGAYEGLLNGTAPDTRPGSQTWDARTTGDGGTFYRADGTVFGWNSVWNSTAKLAFTPQQGNLYALDARILGVSQVAGTSGGSIEIGFAIGDTYERSFTQYNSHNVLMQLGGTNNQVAFYNGSGMTTSAWTSGPAATGDFDLRIILDTNDVSTWTASWWAKRPTDGSYTEVYSASSVPAGVTLNYVGIAGNTARVGGNFESFQLSIIPEPASLGMLGAAAIAMLLRRRFAKK
jgi:hypothetical protein